MTKQLRLINQQPPKPTLRLEYPKALAMDSTYMMVLRIWQSSARLHLCRSSKVMFDHIWSNKYNNMSCTGLYEHLQQALRGVEIKQKIKGIV